MLSEGTVGQRIVQDGAPQELRLGRYVGLAVMDAHARFFDAVNRGNCFQAATATAPFALGTALTATAVTLTLFNPLGSNRNLVVIQSQLALASNGASGTIYYAVNNTQGQAQPSSVTAITPVNLLLGAGTAPVGKAYSVCTLPATPTAVRLLGAVSANVSIGSNTCYTDSVEGALVLTPGMAVTLQGVGTTALLGTLTMAWEEVIP